MIKYAVIKVRALADETSDFEDIGIFDTEDEAFEKAEEVLAAIKTDKYGKDAAIIGEVIDDDKVLIETGIGGVRILETPIADPVPRVC